MKGNVSYRPVVVATKHSGVFFGYTSDSSGQTVKLKNGRMAVYWTSDVRGVIGLASVGPSETCRVSYETDMEVRDVTLVLEVKEGAVQQWEKAPWCDDD